MSLDFSLINDEGEVLFWFNITHNLGCMADKAGLYKVLWVPDENGYIYAKDIVEVLINGHLKLILVPEYFEWFTPSNNWGNVGVLINVVKDTLKACEKYPNSKNVVSK